MVNVVAEAGEEESQDLEVRQEGEVVTALVEHVAEVGHRQGVVPIMIGWVPVTTFYQQNKPEGETIYSMVVTWREQEVEMSTYLASVFGCSFHLWVRPMAAHMLITACMYIGIV